MTLWVARIIASASLLLALLLFYKFTVPAESVVYFSKLGVDPWGRIAAGVIELAAAILLLVPRLSLYGALLTCATMLSAIFVHIFDSGIYVSYIDGSSDNGLLFISACVALLSACYILFRLAKTLLFTNPSQ